MAEHTGTDTDSGHAGTVHDKIARLIRSVPRPKSEGGTLYSVPEVAAGVGVSKQHLYDVIRARKTPGLDLVQGIAQFYRVSMVYFDSSDQAQRYGQQVELLGALGLNDVQDLRFRRGAPLSPQSAKLMLDFARRLQDVESGAGPNRDTGGDEGVET